MDLKDAVQMLITTDRPYRQVAQGMSVDGNEVAAALAQVDPESVEATALRALADFNPVVKPTKVKQVEIKD
jgi:hypothetical protein